jgi:ABC-type branched-subunit amino acid transport system ATPase component
MIRVGAGAEDKLQGGPDRRLARSFWQLRAAGITLVIVEQNLSFARQCTDRLYAVAQGTVRLYAVAQGTVRFTETWQEFVASEDLLSSYL